VADWDVGVKIAGKGVKSSYPIETGLADLFKDLGCDMPK
jgi:hypothetical protein